MLTIRGQPHEQHTDVKHAIQQMSRKGASPRCIELVGFESGGVQLVEDQFSFLHQATRALHVDEAHHGDGVYEVDQQVGRVDYVSLHIHGGVL